jgi:hypothetical protein
MERRGYFFIQPDESIQGLGNIPLRRYSIPELESIGYDGLWDQGHWVSWNATLALGGLSTSANTKFELKGQEIEPATPRIKPMNELKRAEEVAALDDGEGVLLTSPAMLAGAVDSSSPKSATDDEDFYSVDDRESRSQNHNFITPTISSGEESVERFEHLKSNYEKSQTKTPEPVVQASDSDLESLKSVSEPESDTGSWVNEPTTVELEEQLQEKNELAKKLFRKLQAAESQLDSTKLQNEMQLQEQRRTHSVILEGRNQLHKSLEDAFTKNLRACRAECNRYLHAAEDRRLAELAEVEKKIQKCDGDWTAERKSLIAKLEAKAKSDEANSQPSGVTDEGYEELNWQAIEALSQLKAIINPQGKWWMTETAGRVPQSLTLGEIASVIDELRMNLHELASAEQERENPRSTQTIGRAIATPVSRNGNGSNLSSAELVMSIDALVLPRSEPALSTHQDRVEAPSEIHSKQDQSSSALPSSLRALSSRLPRATKDNRELKTRLKGASEKNASIFKQYEAMLEKNTVLLRDNATLQEYAWRVADESHKFPCYCQGIKEDDSVEVPTSALKTQIRNLRQQINTITEERNVDKEIHKKLRGYYFALNTRYTEVVAYQPNLLVEAQLQLATLEKDQILKLEDKNQELERKISHLKYLQGEDEKEQEAKYEKLRSHYSKLCGKSTGLKFRKELDMLQKVKVPALEGQVTGLQQLVANLMAARGKERELRNAINSSLVTKYELLSKEHEELKANHQSAQEGQNSLEPEKESLQLQLIAMKNSIEMMEEGQEARHKGLQRQLNSLSRQRETSKRGRVIEVLMGRNAILETELSAAKDTITKYGQLSQAHTQLQRDHESVLETQKQLVRSQDNMEIERNTAEHERSWLETRLAELEDTEWARSRRREDSGRPQPSTSLKQKLKTDKERLVECQRSARETQGQYEGLARKYKQSIAANLALQFDHDKLRAANEKLERAHEVAREAHKVLEDRVQEANLVAYGVQKKLIGIQGVDTSLLTEAYTPHRQIQVQETMRIAEAVSRRMEGEEGRTEVKALENARPTAMVEDVSLDNAELIDLEDSKAQAGTSIHCSAEQAPLMETEASDIGPSASLLLDTEDAASFSSATVMCHGATCKGCEWTHSVGSGSDWW